MGRIWVIKKAAEAERLGAHPVILAADVAAIDARAAALGASVGELMRRAGAQVAAAALEMVAERDGAVLVLAGPGMNGGDGYVAAAQLADSGRDIRVIALSPPRTPEAQAAAADWTAGGGATEPWPGAAAFDGAALIVDALFGVGLSRPLAGEAAALTEAANRSGAPILAVDAPSGVASDSGVALGPAIRADRTVAFVAKKPCHLIGDGAAASGEATVAQILGGVEAAAEAAAPTMYELTTDGLATRLRKATTAHKYDHGSVVAATGGFGATGAARLAATAALRIGAGLVTLAAPGEAMAECAAGISVLMLRQADTPGAFAALLADHRINSVVIGPGHGTGPGGFDRTRETVLAAAQATAAALVLDADALTAFADEPERLFAALRARGGETALTPHQGEFARLFPDLAPLDKATAARAAAARAGAVVLLKGPDTVIAQPDGLVGVASAFGARAAPWLATAGSGDVLAGLVAGAAARRPAGRLFEAASDAAVLHQEAGRRGGPGLIADDLPKAAAEALRALS